MKLYHTGYQEIRIPDLTVGRKNADFGQGFYLTPDRAFAERWAQESRNALPRVNHYSFFLEGLRVQHFTRDSDWFGYTKSGILNVAVACASDWAGWSEGERVRGTRNFDCLNVVAVDTNISQLKLVRIGDQVDSSLREKRVLSYDYKEKKVIFNA